MAESAVEKLLRLAVVPPGRKPVQVRQYPRVSSGGRPEVVRQHVQGHVVGGRHQQPAVRMAAFGSLKVGQVIEIARQRYRVQRVNVPRHHTPAAKGKPNTKGTTSGKATGSKGQGVSAPANNAVAAAQKKAAAAKLFGTPQQNPEKAALNGQRIPAGTATVTSELVSLASGSAWFVTLPAGFPVRLVGG